jgi:hypothetical protein
LRAYKTGDPHGDNSFGSRCAGAFVAAMFAAPACLFAWWLLNYHLLDAPISLRMALYAYGAFIVFGFVFPRALPGFFGKFLEILFGAARSW